MKKNVKKYRISRVVFTMLLSVSMIITFIPVSAYAESDNTTGAENTVGQTEDESLPEKEDINTENDSSDGMNIDFTYEYEPEDIYPTVEVDDSDELLMQFLENKARVDISNAPTEDGSQRQKYYQPRKSNLTGPELKMYNILAPKLEAVASGEIESTDFRIPVREVFGDKLEYSAEDLGYDTLSGHVSEAVDDFYDIFYYDYGELINALLIDMPYDLYWFDKTKGISIDRGGAIGCRKSEETGEYVIAFMDEDPQLKFELYVSSDYSVTGDRRTSDVDTSKTKKAAAFADNTADIILAYENDSDIDKLKAYKQEICDAVEFNYAAVAENVPYGDPWQLIWVFDNDDSTNVVCEGYSKAFQFLCNLTEFDSSKIDCYRVTGKMGGGTGEGNHMWNVLHMNDDNNYLVDITNCDQGTIGYPDLLFMKKPLDEAVTGYDYSFDVLYETISYKYDEYTKSLYSEDELILADKDYESGTEVEWTEPEYVWAEDNSTVTARRVCVNDASQVEEETVSTTNEETAPAACETGSVTRFTAEFRNEAFTKQFKDVTNNDALGHDWGEWITDKDATDEEEGHQHRVCSRDASHTEEKTLPKTHSHSMQKVALKKATASAAGNIAYWKCTDCGKFFSDADGQNEITKEQTVIPKVTAPAGKVTILNTIADTAAKTNDVIWDKSKVTGATGYIVEWRARGATKWVSAKVGNVTRGVTNGLTVGNLYEIRVTPYKAATEKTAEVKGTPSAIVYRYFYTAQKITLTSSSKGTFKMSWAKDTKATSYQVLYTTNKNGAEAAQNIKTASKTATSITVKDIKVDGKTQALKSGTTYYVQIREVRTVDGINYIGNISNPMAVKVK